ncbi:PilC/PilY family type IV pilus protein [Acinetobacter sp. YH01021]|uniref:PilC/PilY family type IV pilus protein n=1 Tax=Acinetobacter sp. YH01021 TaxID=2601035 RepID=UPI0015D373C0|nr:PilC/PilY family type IV pilus protein [Acinetobacter sp. YH01021]
MKSKIDIATNKYKGKPSKLNISLVVVGAFFSNFMITSSVAQASDLQIYAAPTAGKKTIVMMLDTSGSMAFFDDVACIKGYDWWGNEILHGTGEESVTTTVPYTRRYCKNSSGKISSYDRLTRLKDGMFAFLNSDNASLQEVRVGLGNYSTKGDGKSGQILVPAAKLVADQRTKLKNAIANLEAKNGTPTAQAYAEAAAYLMGTNTSKVILVNDADVYFTYGSNYYRSCTSVNATGTFCLTWSDWVNEQIPSRLTSGLPVSSCRLDGYNGKCYKKTGKYIINNDSGFGDSADSTKDTDLTYYSSPLPAEKERQSCDGQGIYLLSDGAANSTSETRAKSVMSEALGTFGSGFSCSGGLAEAYEGSNPGAWTCMGEFAKKLFDKTKNPTGVSIQTAFVGFGSDMNNLSNTYVANACKLSSLTQADRNHEDDCSPTKETYGIQAPGYGNGGFFIANDSDEITNSVIQFIDNIGKNPIDPLSTGAISVPVDALSPHTFQPYGYLRAMEPKPGTQNMIWIGNLKKYSIQNGALKSDETWIFNTDGTFAKTTKDIWNKTAKKDGDGIDVGGVISNLILPTSSTTGHRPVFTDIARDTNGNLTAPPKKTNLFLVSRSATDASKLLKEFKEDSVLVKLKPDIKLKLLNYFGYTVSLNLKELPSTLTAPDKAGNIAMGASIHSFPVQMTYSGELDANGDLKSSRNQSVLYGSMEGALRVVDASSGREQSVFVPYDILQDETASKALVSGQSDKAGVTAGISGAWVADSAYKVTAEDENSTLVSATKMNVYGGMRMGGKNYYGLDMLIPTAPKILFKITGGLGSFSRMGQTWSKPVLANIRYNKKITRVMIVGGGYDMCYENPTFALNKKNSNTDYPDTACDNKTEAQGNAIYIVNADTGDLIWWASNKDGDTNNSFMKHSIVSRIATLDRDGDGLVDNLYFGDLGGQVFRADLNNTSGSVLGKRVVLIADLSTGKDVNGTTLTAGNQPRFYQPPTLTVHDEGKETFLLVGIASGDRSTPLDVSPVNGREKMKPLNVLSDRPTNKVYGLIDRDVASKYLYTGQKDGTGVLKDFLPSNTIKLDKLVPNPQTLTGEIAKKFSSSGYQGWYRSLSSGPDGIEIKSASIIVEGKTISTTRTPGGLKAFEEEPLAITGRLLIPVYDPQGTGIEDRSNPCQPRVIGETDVQQFCLPYGACLKSTGTVDTEKEKLTGFQMSGIKNQNVLGAGIRGLSMGPTEAGTPSTGNAKSINCGALTVLGLQSGKGKWECSKILNPTRWYEKYVEAKTN